MAEFDSSSSRSRSRGRQDSQVGPRAEEGTSFMVFITACENLN